MKLRYYSPVITGNLDKKIEMLIQEELWEFEGKNIEITIQAVKDSRTLAQNRLFHMHVGILAKEFGYTTYEMKEVLKYKFLMVSHLRADGSVDEMIEDTSSLSKERFADLINEVVRFAAGYGVVLPLPEDIQA